MAGCAVSVAPVNAELSVLGHSGHAGGLAPSAGLAEMGLHRVGRPDVLPPQQRSRSWAFGWHPRIRPADTGACQVDWSGSVTALRRPSCGRFCMTQTSIPRLAGRVQPWRRVLTTQARLSRPWTSCTETRVAAADLRADRGQTRLPPGTSDGGERIQPGRGPPKPLVTS